MAARSENFLRITLRKDLDMKFSAMGRLLGVAAIVFFAAFQWGCSFQRQFDAPEAAASALAHAIMIDDEEQLLDVLGEAADELIYSGDPVQDDQAISRFVAAYNQKHKLVKEADGSYRMLIGDDEWPVPIPIVQDEWSKKWFFDTEAGKDELLSRRIGRNELNTLQVLLAYVDAQKEYAQMDPEKHGLPVYAEKVLSDAGKKNGLYWEAKEGEQQSPLGSFAAEAEEEGYTIPTSQPKTPQAYHGYFFRILKAQGAAADGGERSYIINGKMIGGFAMIAVPANYGVTGVMSFIVNHDGVIYQTDLGKDSVKEAATITAYNPDSRWKKVDEKDLQIDMAAAGDAAEETKEMKETVKEIKEKAATQTTPK
jgi:hypothetical protein